jgi:DivIVA domain-containing protein
VLRIVMRGYDRDAVDAFLARCRASLGDADHALPELRDVRPPVDPLPPLDAGDVRAVQFPVTLRGYDMAQVDELLNRFAAALPAVERRPGWDVPPPAAVPAGTGPGLRKVVRGYDVAEVDAFLSRCAHTLAESGARRIGAVPELAPLLRVPRTGEPLRARDVEVVQFHVRGRGYDIEQVDALLDRVAVALSE